VIGVTTYATFLRRALREPALIGAPAPTGSALAAELVAHLRRTLPWLEVLPGDAAALRTLLADADVGRRPRP
jgi:phospholipid N-methyltransferase